MHVYLNGEFLPLEQARISVEDRGFLFGDGVYEVTRALPSGLFAEAAHWHRLQRGIEELKLQTPEGFSRELVKNLSLELLEANGLTGRQATVYLQLTRGAAPRNHAFPPAGTPPTLYLSASPFQVPWTQRREGVSTMTLPDLRWARCDLKTVNLLPNILAKQQAREAGVFEALLVRDGVITEGASTSAFFVMDGALHTHPKGPHILPGVTQDIVISLAQGLGMTVHERPVRLDERDRFQEVFLAGTTTDVQPVIAVNGAKVGEGKPGPLTMALQRALYERMGMEPPP
ncbi:aminotransferase class IV [Pyxidicoccus xibeiensis]|uniref:aminotransferase class IV n=1 Tax=Pyxidicoccus xibeiensis TaxID=2906759 RepID=UPI0020A7EDDA|nr:aminotransferase class IV [Pyxidicoccus xibeiensis]MCP3142160.1 aminotransferase class IV [Pyxidicoccus xibeiensis]